MGSTSCAVRNRWNAKHYDRLNITIPKGWAEKLKEFCAVRGESVNGLVVKRIRSEIDAFKQKEGE